jgi:hypothetical protein
MGSINTPCCPSPGCAQLLRSSFLCPHCCLSITLSYFCPCPPNPFLPKVARATPENASPLLQSTLPKTSVKLWVKSSVPCELHAHDLTAPFLFGFPFSSPLTLCSGRPGSVSLCISGTPCGLCILLLWPEFLFLWGYVPHFFMSSRALSNHLLSVAFQGHCLQCSYSSAPSLQLFPLAHCVLLISLAYLCLLF